jgi:dienelactone hydrolase
MKLLLEHAAPLIDQPVTVRVTGARPRQVVRLRAESVDARSAVFRSWAEYQAGPDGTVVVGRQAPRAGTYRGVDAFGLWWSMAADPERQFARDLRPVPTTVAAEVGRRQVARLDFERPRVAPGVWVEELRSDGLVATVFVPPERLPAPGVLVLGGSEGGLAVAAETAALLASHGFVSMALAYFAQAALPPVLSEVPLEYLERAVQWLLGRPDVAGPGVGVVGRSRGGELALLLASACRQVLAVVGLAASSVLWPGFTPGALRPEAAWTRRGKGLPFVVPRPRSPARDDRPLALLDWCRDALQDGPELARATIPVERIRGAVLLVSGADDRMWPSRWLAERALERLAASRRGRPHSHPYLHLTYPGAGHGVGHPPGLPEPPAIFTSGDGTTLDLGGSRAGNARSAQRAWPRVTDFLGQHLRAERAAP